LKELRISEGREEFIFKSGREKGGMEAQKFGIFHCNVGTAETSRTFQSVLEEQGFTRSKAKQQARKQRA